MNNSEVLTAASAHVSLGEVRQTLLACAEAAAARTLPLFRTKLAVENKHATAFDPVTEADRGAEQAIREVIERDFPDHAIIGEEWDSKETGSPFSWIIDPVDGTRAFMSGVPVWGTLVGVTYKGRSIAGLMSQPFTGETWIASDGKSQLVRDGVTTDLAVSEVRDLDTAILFTTTPALFAGPGQRRAYDAVEEKVRLTRYGCDCYAYALLACGHVDLIVEPGMNTYDIAALVPVIENAGGVVCTWDGGRPEAGGNIIAAATPELVDAALATMRDHLQA